MYSCLIHMFSCLIDLHVVIPMTKHDKTSQFRLTIGNIRYFPASPSVGIIQNYPQMIHGPGYTIPIYFTFIFLLHKTLRPPTQPPGFPYHLFQRMLVGSIRIAAERHEPGPRSSFFDTLPKESWGLHKKRNKCEVNTYIYIHMYLYPIISMGRLE